MLVQLFDGAASCLQFSFQSVDLLFLFSSVFSELLDGDLLLRA